MNRLLVTLFLLTFIVFQTTNTSAFDRPHQPVILSGNHFSEMIGSPIDHFVLMKFNNSSNSWSVIPFQIDQVTDGSFFGQHSGVLQEQDELVFMAKNLADEAPDSSWPNLNASIIGRYKIELNDPLVSGAEGRGFVYLFLAMNSFAPSTQDLVSADQVNDRLVSRYFEMGFNQSNGLPVDLQITSENGGDNLDFLDRLKIHIVGQFVFFGSQFTVPLDEESGIVKFDSTGFLNPRFVDGQVRVIRDLFIKLQVPLGGLGTIPLPGFFLFRMQFYPYSMEVKLQNLDFSILAALDGQLNSIRISFDNNAHALGMNFLNPTNTISIDGNTDNNVNSSLSVPGYNWNLVSGNPGSMFTNTLIPALGDEQLLYFHDDKNGGSGDGTDDTGDGASYGDAGFIARGSITSGSFDFLSNLYFLPANFSRTQAEQLFAQDQNPLQLTKTVFETQTTDVTSETRPVRFFLLRVYPNPYSLRNSGTLKLQFNLIRRDDISLSLVNALGQVIARRKPQSLSAGQHQINWDLQQLTKAKPTSGLYWIVAQGKTSRLVQKLLLLR